MRDVRYEKGKAKQQLETISVCRLEGDFDEALAKFKRELDSAREDYGRPRKLLAYYADSYSGSGFPRETLKEVKFDRLSLAFVVDENCPVLEIWGERDILPEEQAALDSKAAAQSAKWQERDREELKRLKALYEKA
jgi:hypothetical protein